jgi:hypothetical protein
MQFTMSIGEQCKVITLSNDDLRPIGDSLYAWRWQDPKYDVLPDSVLFSLKSIRAEKARELAQRLRELDHWAQAAPDRTIDIENLPDRQIATALLGLDANRQQAVIASWEDDEAILLPWENFAQFWSSFCYPSSDDVTVVPLSEAWALSYSHEERFFWRTR